MSSVDKMSNNKISKTWCIHVFLKMYLNNRIYVLIKNFHTISKMITLFLCFQQLLMKGFAGVATKIHAKSSMVAGEAVSNICAIVAFNVQSKKCIWFNYCKQWSEICKLSLYGLCKGTNFLALYHQWLALYKFYWKKN